jgi:HEPN domain-containing protein
LILEGTLKFKKRRGEKMPKGPEEWLKQADYDLDTANFMFKGGRYFYTVFMCHLSIEKALKGLYHGKLDEIPPKTHNLIYLINKVGFKPPEDIGRFLVKLNQASIVTRYPEDLAVLEREYTQSIVKELLLKTRETLGWIKTIFQR